MRTTRTRFADKRRFLSVISTLGNTMVDNDRPAGQRVLAARADLVIKLPEAAKTISISLLDDLIDDQGVENLKYQLDGKPAKILEWFQEIIKTGDCVYIQHCLTTSPSAKRRRK